MAWLCLAASLAGCARTTPSGAPPPRLEFSRMLVHWRQYIDPGYLAFVDEVQPEVVQAGFYGVDFWALAHVPKDVKGPTAATHAVDGDLRASGEFLEKLNGELRRRGIKVIGHFDTTYHVTGLVDGPQGPREGFFKFYNELWDERELGPKPVKDPLALLQRRADGSLYSVNMQGFSRWPLYHGCLNNPHWRAVLKAMVKRGIERGVDGFVINYFYTNGCMCQHCVRGFREHLRRRYSPEDLLRQFGIADLDTHRFAEINGWYKRNEMTPLRLEGQRFSDISRKRAFDEVFIEYGRSLKADLILSQWLHSYQPMPSNDERFMLPPELWAKGEDYLWYCVGQDEATLQMRYMRGAGGDRPFAICHYEAVKVRAAMAELAANGGAPMTRYANFNDPASRQELARFFRFMKRHDAVYHASRMAGEAVLLHPRSHLQQGRFTDVMAGFHAVGERLLNDHVLFDVLPDDRAAGDVLKRYRRVFTVSSLPEISPDSYQGLSRFTAPETVRVSASRPERGAFWDLHFVNYARAEPKQKTGLIADENPIPVNGVAGDLTPPPGSSIAKIEWMTPEAPDPRELPLETAGGRTRFRAPEFLVYGVARVHLGPASATPAAASVRRVLAPLAALPPRAVLAAARPPDDECDPAACGHRRQHPEPRPPAADVTENYREDIRAARRQTAGGAR
jgi:hypothetical protein